MSEEKVAPEDPRIVLIVQILPGGELTWISQMNEAGTVFLLERLKLMVLNGETKPVQPSAQPEPQDGPRIVQP